MDPAVWGYCGLSASALASGSGDSEHGLGRVGQGLTRDSGWVGPLLVLGGLVKSSN